MVKNGVVWLLGMPAFANDLVLIAENVDNLRIMSVFAEFV